MGEAKPRHGDTQIEGLSGFLDDWCRAHPERLDLWRSQGRVDTHSSPEPAAAPDPDTADDFDAALRGYRDEQLAIIAWRDLAGIDALDATLAALTGLAERCIEAALAHAEKQVAQRYGRVRDGDGRAQRLVVIGMGKLGGGELNFSSDIDLIFSYRAAGESDGPRCLDADSYYKRIARTLVQCLNETTANGFVYRVDTRLRPFGEAGSLVASISAMEAYYQSHGREWERYAWVKARPVAGDMAAGQALLDKLRPFVYRRYLDYSTFESIRDMKALIERQGEQSGLAANIKLGRGGIREIEFIVQAFQLIRGGQQPALQDNRLLPTLARLTEAEHLPAHTGRELDRAYRFLRRLENRLQMRHDQQTHELPDDDAARVAVARAMGHADWPSLAEAIEAIRDDVHDAFEQIFASPQAEGEGAEPGDRLLLAFWEGTLDDSQAKTLLAEYGIDDPEPVRAAITDLQEQSLYRALEDRGRRWLMRLIPLLFSAAGHSDDPAHALVRTLGVLAALIGRSTYMALLVEHPAALSMLVRLCAASAWITSRITQTPALLDSLLDPRQLFTPPRREELAANLGAELAAIDSRDLERRMDSLRRFTQTAQLRIAAADVSRSMPLMIVSDNLTELAEVVLEAALDIARWQMQQRYGRPCDEAGACAAFAVIGYGKLGGLEMSYTSDLDLVFVYDGDSQAMTDGDRPLSYQAYFTRLSQRLIHILSTQTAAGRAYEIDMRLRPSGKAGLMVSSIEAFARYQDEHAWTWEQQALVRARYVAGDAALGQRFADIRRRVLTGERDYAALARQVRRMRQRMVAAKDESTDAQLDVKQMRGGLIDIEFLAQYAALRYGPQRAEVVRFTDTIRILETLESGGIASYESVRRLTNAYREYRQLAHAQSLQQQRTTIGHDQLADMRSGVAAIWDETIGSSQAGQTSE